VGLALAVQSFNAHLRSTRHYVPFRPLETRRTLRTDVIDYTSITGDAKKIREQRLKKSCLVGPQLAWGRLLNYIDKQLGKFLELEQAA
jgi:hypothetical protein